MQRGFIKKVDLKLIQLVKDNPVLYDYNNPNYIDFNAREVAWQKIGDALEKPAADCKIRWVHMRDAHRRICRRSLLPNAMRPKRAYKYDTELDFMKMFYRDISMPTTAAVKHPSDQEDEADKSSDNWNDVVLEFHETDDEKPLRKRKKTPKEPKNYFEEVDVMVPSTIIETGTNFDPSNPVDAFLISIGTTLKRFSPYHLNIAKSKIFHIVQEHDLQQIVERQQGRGEPSASNDNGTVYFQA